MNLRSKRERPDAAGKDYEKAMAFHNAFTARVDSDRRSAAV
jgi:hypothetical protein